jgi:uncharacterized protein YjbI with pentapeptide repeats
MSKKLNSILCTIFNKNIFQTKAGSMKVSIDIKVNNGAGIMRDDIDRDNLRKANLTLAKLGRTRLQNASLFGTELRFSPYTLTFLLCSSNTITEC